MWRWLFPEFHNKLSSFVSFHTAGRISVPIQGCKIVTYVIRLIHLLGGAHGGAVGWGTVLQPKGRGFDSHWVEWNFSLTDSFRPHYGSEVNSASNRNEYRGADKSLARPGRKHVLKHRSLWSMSGTCAISTASRCELSSSFAFLQGKAPMEIHAILTETFACFLLGRAKDL
jgi:hypothetical protein